MRAQVQEVARDLTFMWVSLLHCYNVYRSYLKKKDAVFKRLLQAFIYRMKDG